MSDQLSIGELSDALAVRTESFCRHYFPEGRKNGNYWHIGDVSGSKGKSLAIRINASGGRKAGSWNDYAGGTDDYGDLIDLLQKHLGHSNLGDTLTAVRAFLGERPSAALIADTPSPAEEANDRIERSKKLFKFAKTTYRTLASAYLLGRGIKRFGPALRYHKSVYVWTGDDEPEKHPALLAKITDNKGIMTGVARYFLDPKTKKLADIEDPKRVLGTLYGNGVRFQTGLPQEDLIVGEGLENVLSVGTALPDWDLTSCLTANHLGLFEPPKGIKRLWIARDNDDVGEQAAISLRKRAEGVGLWCGDLIPQTDDYNDDLKTLGPDKLAAYLSDEMSILKSS